VEQDTAGQARFHNLARSYLRGTDAYVMVYNVENAQSLADLERVWLPKIRQHSDVHIPIFLGTSHYH
jgi:GTPase SAR1 family protein